VQDEASLIPVQQSVIIRRRAILRDQELGGLAGFAGLVRFFGLAGLIGVMGELMRTRHTIIITAV
jgi:hypothetical protein